MRFATLRPPRPLAPSSVIRSVPVGRRPPLDRYVSVAGSGHRGEDVDTAVPETLGTDDAVPPVGANDPDTSPSATDAGVPTDAGAAPVPADAGRTPAPAPPVTPPAPAAPCCTITTQTVATSPTDRARRKIGVGERVKVSAGPGAKTWSVVGDGTVAPASGPASTFTAGDSAGKVTLKATAGACTCEAEFTVVQPDGWTMERKPGSKVKHTKDRPDCGWRGITWFHPDDVSFLWIQDREKDSTATTAGSYTRFSGVKHGNYAGGFSGWFGLTRHAASKGTTDDTPDEIYSGDPGVGDTGAAPGPFKVGTMSFPITLQWRVGTGSEHDLPVVNQEHEIFATGRCESRKGGNTESALFSDATSGYA